MKLLIILLLTVLATATAYSILCIQAVPTKSHYNMVRGVSNALLDAGHEVTMVTPFPDKKETKNLKFIDVNEVLEVLASIDLLNIHHTSKMGFDLVMEMARNMSMTIGKNPTVRSALTKTQFDAVVTEWFYSDFEAGYAAVQQVPWILLTGTSYTPHLENLVDTVRSIPTVPVMMNVVPIPMSFLDRVKNTLWYTAMSFGTSMWYSTSESDYQTLFEPIAKARGVPLPAYSEALHNISVVFVNTHSSMEPVRSAPPNVVEIAGYHISKEVAPLPKDLQELLDSSKKGVIYFSMGSALKSALLNEHTKADLLKLFGQLPYTVLWKFEEPLENFPKNVHVRPWMPQSSILAHPNVKVFITHGGLLSKLESLHFAVPTIVVPVFGDQPMNAARSEREGIALKVDLGDNLAEDLGVALQKMLNDDSYSKKVKHISRLFHNRPVPPSKLIQHYVEMAIETKGAYHLRSKALLYKWYELWMLDQLVFFLLVIFVLYTVVKKLTCILIKKLFKTNTKIKKN